MFVLEIAMRLFALTYFKTVADTGNLTKAAEALNISPSTLSQSIKKLESSLGVDLFIRSGRNIKLSEYGKAYLPYVNKILLLDAQSIDTINKMKTDAGSYIRVADLTHVFASDIITGFILEHPEIKVHREYVQPDGAAFADLKNNYDFIIGSNNVVERPDLKSCEIRSSHSLCAFVHESNPLSSRKSLTLSELADEPMIAFAENTPGRKMINSLFSSIGTPNIIFEGNSPAAMKPALANNLGIFIQPSQSAALNKDKYGEHVCLIPIVGCSYNANTSLYWSVDRILSPSAKLFRTYCRQYAKKNNLIEEE